MTDGLTEKQSEILRFVQYFLDSEGYPPTRREIAEGMAYKSDNAAQEHLLAIERKGWIELRPGIARGIKIVRRLLA